MESNRCLVEVSKIGHELAQVGDQLTDLTAHADVCFLYSSDSRYALNFQPCLTNPGTADGDKASYERIFDVFYRALFDARAQLTTTYDVDALDQYRVVVAPAFYIADDASLESLVEYARQGGHLVLTFRSGYADDRARARWMRAPGLLREAVGAGYNLYSNLERPVPVSAVEDFPLHDESAAEG